MSKKILILLSLVLVSTSLAAYEAGNPRSKKISAELGLNIANWGLAVDAVYDPDLDNLVPGYKILNIVITNRGRGIIYLDVQKDKWVMQDAAGKTHLAINHLRIAKPKLWESLPNGLKEKLDYPNAVRVSNSGRIDVFFPSSIDLTNFRQMSWKSTFFKKEFVLMRNTGEATDTPKPDPDSDLVQKNPNAKEKYETPSFRGEEKEPPAEEEPPPPPAPREGFSMHR